jgi:hypothetical protein
VAAANACLEEGIRTQAECDGLSDVADINTVNVGTWSVSMVGVYIMFLSLPVALFMAVLNHIYLKIIKHLELAAPVHLQNYLLLHELERATGHGLTRAHRLERSSPNAYGRRSSAIEPADASNYPPGYLEVEPTSLETEFSAAVSSDSSDRPFNRRRSEDGLALMNQIGQNVLSPKDIEVALSRGKFWYQVNVIVGGLVLLSGLLITLIFLGSFGPERQSRWAISVGKFFMSMSQNHFLILVVHSHLPSIGCPCCLAIGTTAQELVSCPKAWA